MARHILSFRARSAFNFVGSYNLAVYERHEYFTPVLIVPPGRYTHPSQARAAAEEEYLIPEQIIIEEWPG